MIDLNNIVKDGCIPDDWRKSILVLVPVYNEKGDPLVCGSYRAIKLLEQPMKVLERVLEKRIRCQVSIDNMQFGFMPGHGSCRYDQISQKSVKLFGHEKMADTMNNFFWVCYQKYIYTYILVIYQYKQT